MNTISNNPIMYIKQFIRFLLGICLFCIAFLLPDSALGQSQDTTLFLEGTWKAEEQYFKPLLRFEIDKVGKINAFLTGDSSVSGTPFSSASLQGDSPSWVSNE